MSSSKHGSIPARASSKGREFFFQHVSFPMRDASPVELEKFWAWNSQDQSEVNPRHHWDCAGPFNIAGRVTSLVIHPADPKKWFAGSAAGGVWMSTDEGASWVQTWSRFANQSIGALGWTKWDGMWVLIAATGEANMSADTYPGSGMYHSLDDGLVWSNFLGKPPGRSVEEDVRRKPRRIGCLAFAKDGPIAFGSVYMDDSMPAGLYLIDVPNRTYTPVEFWGERSYNCHSVLFHPRDSRIMYASIEPDGALNGIWRSSDGGACWEHLTRGLPSGDNFRRVSLAFAPSDPDVMYALAASRANRVLGVFRSTNGGNSWREILCGRFPKERQMSYNNAIAIHPSKPDSVVWGGMKLYRTDDAGRQWRQITTSDRSAANYVHNDHHVILWPEPDKIISGNDGGVSVSKNGGRTWTERSRGMVTSMFYGVGVAPSNGSVFGGGTQDNGILIAGVGGNYDGEFFGAIPGDGAWIVFDRTDEENVFAAATSFDIFHHRSGDPWDFEHWKYIRPRQISDGERKQRSFTVLAKDAPARKGTNQLWAASARLWRTDSNGRHWRPVSPAFDGSPISAIEISRANPRVMFVGTTSGGIFRSVDGGVTWSQSLSAANIPARPITCIETHPKSAAEVVVTIAASGITGSGVQLRTGDCLPYGHVFYSCDCGATWDDIDQGTLPNVAFYSAAFETHPPYRLFLAGDLGVWVAIKDRWLNINGNLPNVVVSDLVYHHRDRTLTAATYGRGVWRMRPGRLLASPPRIRRRRQETIHNANKLRVDPTIATPRQLSPPDRAVLASYPRVVEVTAKAVPGAAGYQFEFSSSDGLPNILFGSTDPQCILRFRGGGKKGKWRVSTIKDGLCSRPSAWRSFRFLR
jgi:photosystem II stability/assembly factor-like uncharacterized protein